MAAWKSLILILAMLVSGMAMSQQAGNVEPLDAGDMTQNGPKNWGTMDGKSPFRLIRADQ